MNGLPVYRPPAFQVFLAQTFSRYVYEAAPNVGFFVWCLQIPLRISTWRQVTRWANRPFFLRYHRRAHWRPSTMNCCYSELTSSSKSKFTTQPKPSVGLRSARTPETSKSLPEWVSTYHDRSTNADISINAVRQTFANPTLKQPLFPCCRHLRMTCASCSGWPYSVVATISSLGYCAMYLLGSNTNEYWTHRTRDMMGHGRV